MNYIAVLKGLKKREVREEITYLLERLHILDVASRKISTLSGGMKQRVLMAQALLGDPDFIILDEPTVGLDPVERYDFLNFVRELSKTWTILYATHGIWKRKRKIFVIWRMSLCIIRRGKGRSLSIDNFPPTDAMDCYCFKQAKHV